MDIIETGNDMAIQKIGKMSLQNWGGFVAKMSYSWIDEDGNKQYSEEGSDIMLGRKGYYSPGDAEVPDGSLVYLYVYVVWGTSNEAKRVFIYEKGNAQCANYTISGTTLNNSLGFVDITDETGKEAAPIGRKAYAGRGGVL